MAWNKELTRGSRLEADSDGTRLEDGVTKATWIGNHVGIGNMLGIDQEGRSSLNREGGGYAGVEGRQNEWDPNWKLS